MNLASWSCNSNDTFSKHFLAFKDNSAVEKITPHDLNFYLLVMLNYLGFD